MRLFESAILIFFQQKPFFLLHFNENKQPVHMRYHLFLQYGWFLQNLGKDFTRTNMHTTVALIKLQYDCKIKQSILQGGQRTKIFFCTKYLTF